MNHYNKAAQVYNNTIFYMSDTDYERWYLSNILKYLKLPPKSKKPINILDLGCGTTRTAELIAEYLDYRVSITCVDSCKTMLDLNRKPNCLNLVCDDILSFVMQLSKNSANRVLMKEVIHHLDITTIPSVYKAIYEALEVNGLFLTCTRPHKINYPFFREAYRKWQQHQPPHNFYVSVMRDVGFTDININQLSFPIEISRDDWINFIQQRCWSTFDSSEFSDDQLNKGIEEIKSEYKKVNTLKFNDEIIFITATKK
jgi:ubiquinone/menaquinone biosynthesis C-methylase UbiE